MKEETMVIMSKIQKLKALFASLRMSTRVWFDIIAPVTMLLLLKDGNILFLRYVLVVAVVLTFHAGQTLFNDISDIEVDRHSIEPSRNQRSLIQGKLSKREMGFIGWLLIILSIIFIAILPWPSVLTIVIALPLVLAYNFKPIQISARSVSTQFFWSFIWVLIFYLCTAALQSGVWKIALPYLVFVVMFMGLGESITQDIRDVDNDAAGGRQTTVVKYGVSRTIMFAWIIQALSLAAWVWLMQTYPLPMVSGIVSCLIIIVWLIYFGKLSLRLRKAYNKADARMTHIGSIITFTGVNLVTIGSIIFLV